MCTTSTAVGLAEWHFLRGICCQVWCGGLNVLYKLRGLDICLQIGGTVWVGLGVVAFAEGSMPLGAEKATCHSQFILCSLLVVVQEVSLSLLLQLPCLLLSAMLPNCDSLSRTISQINPSFGKLFWSWCLSYSALLLLWWNTMAKEVQNEKPYLAYTSTS